MQAEELEEHGQQIGGLAGECRHAWPTRQGRLLRSPQQAESAEQGRRAGEASKAVGRRCAAAETGHVAALQPCTTAYNAAAAWRYPETSTGRRLAFARWIADRDNPLRPAWPSTTSGCATSARPSCRACFDFGRNGRPPSHPALLDWLAAEFMERGWSMKAMHRLIVTSSTYRLAPRPTPPTRRPTGTTLPVADAAAARRGGGGARLRVLRGRRSN